MEKMSKKKEYENIKRTAMMLKGYFCFLALYVNLNKILLLSCSTLFMEQNELSWIIKTKQIVSFRF